MSSISAIEIILSKLPAVRPSGDKWRADCPNGHKSRSNLSIKCCENGSVLLHCHAGCGPHEVMQGLGLTLADLYDRPIDTKPRYARRSPQEIKEYHWKAAFKYLPEEISIVMIGSQDVSEGRPLNDEDQARFELACERLQTAMETLK
jgi:hypothetical protein